MAEKGFTLVEQAKVAGNDWTWLEMAGNCCNGQKWLNMDLNDWKGPKMAGMAEHCFEIDGNVRY